MRSAARERSRARHHLVIAPSDSNVLYTAGNKSREVFVSRTGGRAWTVVTGRGLPEKSCGPHAVDPLDPAILYGVCDYRLFKSTDGATSWTAVTNELPANEEINTVRVDFRRPGVVFAGVGHRLFKSTSGGASWTAIGEFPDIIYDVLTGSLATPDMIVVSSRGALFRTDDGGSHWTSIGDDLNDTIIENVVIDPASDTTLYAATFRGLFVTTDSGAHWRQSPSLGLLRSWVWMITVDGGNPATVRILTD